MRFLTLFFFLPSLTWAASFEPLETASLSSLEKCLQIAKAYPGAIKEVDETTNTVTFNNDALISCDDSLNFDLKQKSDYLEQINQVDISDILMQEYPDTYAAPMNELNLSPGRFRNDQVFINTYLSLEKASDKIKKTSAKKELSPKDLKTLSSYLSKNIVKVKFLGFSINMNKRNGAADALKRVGQRLEKEAPDSAKWLKKNRNMAGGYNMRFISGTKRLSAHSWGIAIDFTVKVSTDKVKWFDAYWKWIAECLAPLKCPPARTNKGVEPRKKAKESQLAVTIYEDNFDHFPEDLVQIFAEEGFIWGGHWHHFDTMHFEYRPEFFQAL